ncbi:interleukin-1 receptor type 1-like isoform X1 [Carassius auratus]|uniref:Interleukin-1 receptor type 1-like isoform X1 n=2 Tax=Carassius auratus TaxID=7957 RepID=A0A6P6KP01_CARAU|nr:interleukin-1 receptor type 1-like isoform X1 [Carassius auratus]
MRFLKHSYMGRSSLVFLVAVLQATECAVLSTDTLGPESCKDYGQAFDRMFPIPGEAAILECPLEMHYLFNTSETPYNVTWYDERTGSEITELEQSIMLKETQLWFFNVSMQQQGKYTCVVRTQSECYKQATGLVVTEMTSENCERPERGGQRIKLHVNDLLACPLRKYLKSVDSPSIQWYKNCELLQEDEKFTPILDMLNIRNVDHEDAGFYTCKMTFRLAGVVREMAETINCEVNDEYLMKPDMIEPVNEIIKVDRGSSFRKDCVVVVRGKGIPMVDVFWVSEEELISFDTSHRIHQKPMNESRMKDGFLVVQTLFLSAVWEEDFYVNFTCMASSGRGQMFSQISLVPAADGNLFLLLGLLLGSMALFFVMGVLLCTIFKVELSLWVRTVFPFLYKTTDGDGKQYDAYIAYPRVLEGSSEKAEIFAMSTLPQVLEGQYGYKLFILGRDGLPGEAVVDVVQDALSRCRRLLLLYTASSLCSPEAQDWAEQQTGLYQALVEDSINIVLLELEEIHQPLRLPLAVRLLKDKQGALQAWKRRKRWAFCDGKSEDRVTSLQPSARFWREVRYHMPIRGKAKERNWFSF